MNVRRTWRTQQPLVLLQVVERREVFVAGGACVGAFASMADYVPEQVVWLREVLAAGGAGVGAVNGMDEDVPVHVVGSREV